MKLLGMSGSLRRASHDTAQLRGAAELAPAANAFAIHGLHELPRFDLAVEEQGGAADVAAPKDAFIAAARRRVLRRGGAIVEPQGEALARHRQNFIAQVMRPS